MTNYEKYKDPKERIKKFIDFCQGTNCKDCPLKETITRDTANFACAYAWLDLEAKEEPELLLCPFCGGEAKLVSSVESWVECSVCGVSTKFCACDSGAIEKWNRRVN